jgi:hypothetical protein
MTVAETLRVLEMPAPEQQCDQTIGSRYVRLSRYCRVVAQLLENVLLFGIPFLLVRKPIVDLFEIIHRKHIHES